MFRVGNFSFKPKFLTASSVGNTRAPTSAPPVQAATGGSAVTTVSSPLQPLQGLFTPKVAAPFEKINLVDGAPAPRSEDQMGAIARAVQNTHRTDSRTDRRIYSADTTRLAKAAVKCKLQLGDNVVSHALNNNSEVVDALAGMNLERVTEGTIKDYTPSCLRFERFIIKEGGTLFPVDRIGLAAFICIEGQRLNVSGKSASSIDNMLSGVSFFHNMAEPNAPLKLDTTIQGAVEAVRRHLGYKNTSKDVILPEHIAAMVALKGGPDADLGDIAPLTWMAVALEAVLRFDDMESMKFGSFLWGEDIVRCFLLRTKTDKRATGQWSQIFVSTETESTAYVLLCRMLVMLAEVWDSMSDSERVPYSAWQDPADGSLRLAEIPFLFKTVTLSGGKSFPAPPCKATTQSKTSLYNFTLAQYKTRVEEIGLDPAKHGTHGTRRGGATDAIDAGVPDVLVMHLGRWRSVTSFERYIDDEVSLRLRVAAFSAAGIGRVRVLIDPGQEQQLPLSPMAVKTLAVPDGAGAGQKKSATTLTADGGGASTSKAAKAKKNASTNELRSLGEQPGPRAKKPRAAAQSKKQAVVPPPIPSGRESAAQGMRRTSRGRGSDWPPASP